MRARPAVPYGDLGSLMDGVLSTVKVCLVEGIPHLIAVHLASKIYFVCMLLPPPVNVYRVSHNIEKMLHLDGTTVFRTPCPGNKSQCHPQKTPIQCF